MNTPALQLFFLHTLFGSAIKEAKNWAVKMGAPKLKSLGNRWMMQELRLIEASTAKSLKEW